MADNSYTVDNSVTKYNVTLVHKVKMQRTCSNCPCQSGLTVKYDFGEIVCGSAVSASNFDNNAPLIALPIADEASKYVLVMSDPDAPNPAWIHWLRRDISGSSLKSGQIDGSDIGGFVYNDPTPPKGSGPHRYQFRIYKQDSETVPSISATQRSGFNLDAFVNDNNLGSVFAASCFTVEVQ